MWRTDTYPSHQTAQGSMSMAAGNSRLDLENGRCAIQGNTGKWGEECDPDVRPETYAGSKTGEAPEDQAERSQPYSAGDYG